MLHDDARAAMEDVPHIECADMLRRAYTSYETEAEITERPDHGCRWWIGMVCPHGIGLWAHPTDRQLDLWKMVN